MGRDGSAVFHGAISLVVLLAGAIAHTCHRPMDGCPDSRWYLLPFLCATLGNSVVSLSRWAYISATLSRTTGIVTTIFCLFLLCFFLFLPYLQSFKPG